MDVDQLQPGMVIHAYCHDCSPPKDKFFVIGTIEPSPMMLVINSRMNQYILERQSLHQCHVELDHQKYVFLRHDSWVACCEAYHGMTYDGLERELRYGNNTFCGQLDTDDKQAVIAAIACSPRMERRHKRVLLAAFEQA